MKRLLWASLLLLCLPSLAWAGSGSAIIPYFYRDASTSTHLNIVNIAGVSVDVRIKLYDLSGSLVTNGAEFYNGFSSDPTLNPVSLGSKELGRVSLRSTGSAQEGWGIVEWTSSGNEAIALTVEAHKNLTSGGKGYGHSIPVHNGLPF